MLNSFDNDNLHAPIAEINITPLVDVLLVFNATTIRYNAHPITTIQHRNVFAHQDVLDGFIVVLIYEARV